MSADKRTNPESDKHQDVEGYMKQPEYTYSEHERVVLKAQNRKRKKKKKMVNTIHDRPDWNPKWHLVSDVMDSKRVKKAPKIDQSKSTARSDVKDQAQHDIENDPENNTENITEIDTNNKTKDDTQQNDAQKEHTRNTNKSNSFGVSNLSLGQEYQEDDSLQYSVELPPLEPRWISARDRYTETGTIKTNRSSIQTLPELKPHGQGVYLVAPFYFNGHQQPDQIRFGYSARPTACGLTDPWVDLTMDTNVLPKIEDRHQTTNSPEPFSPRTARKLRKKKDAEGSTMCPQFPVVSMPTTEYDKRTIYYSDVDRLRDQLDKRKLLINRKNKDDTDYKKTKQDFYRMELDSIRSMEPDKKTRMREMYFSYLQNTPGSKKAIKECIKKMG